MSKTEQIHQALQMAENWLLAISRRDGGLALIAQSCPYPAENHTRRKIQDAIILLDTPQDVDTFLDDLQEIICMNIEEPAGRGCGYGITEAGQLEIKKLVENFLKPKG